MSRTVKIKATVTFAWILTFLPGVHAAEDFNQSLSKAASLLNNGKSKPAAAMLRKLVASHPESAEAHMNLGAALAGLVDNNNYDEAIAEEQLALKLDPKSYGARKILGQIYANQNKSQESINILKEACALNPSNYGAYRALGKAQMAANDNDSAEKSFKQAIKLSPDKVDARVKLSGVLLAEGKNKEAVDEARKAVKLDISIPESQLALANALLASGDKAASVEVFDLVFQTNHVRGRRNPLTEASAISGRGWAFSGNESGEKGLKNAIADQRQAIAIFPSFGPAYIRLAELLSRQGNNKEAEQIYKNSMKYSGDDASIAIVYAKFLAKNKRKEEASALLKKVLEKSPNSKSASDALNDIEHTQTNDK